MGIFMVWLFASIIFIAALDVYLITKKGKYYSISANIIRYSHKYPSIPFLIGLTIGFLAGHLFWSMNTTDWSILP